MEAELAGAVALMRDAAVGKCVWGKDDCLLSAANALRPVIGFDPAARFRGQYESKTGALRMLASMGYGSIADAVKDQCNSFGWDRIEISEAMCGDIGVIDILGTQSCALMDKSGFWIARSDKGWAAIPRQAAVIAYRIPRPPHFGAVKAA